jgi:hypothetical protein
VDNLWIIEPIQKAIYVGKKTVNQEDRNKMDKTVTFYIISFIAGILSLIISMPAMLGVSIISTLIAIITERLSILD